MQLIHSRLNQPDTIRDKEMFLTLDGHKIRILLLAAVIFLLNGLKLPSHSSQLLRMLSRTDRHVKYVQERT
jgi:hypothetical protein